MKIGRARLALKCVEAGVPFLVEKPLAVTLDGVDALLAKAREKGVEARVGYVRRCAFEVGKMRRQLLEGRVGELRMAYAYDEARDNLRVALAAKQSDREKRIIRLA
ncbi:MAG: Gfo/Idh/MocA family oxidoreductase [Kiritimatiellia bacterium]